MEGYTVTKEDLSKLLQDVISCTIRETIAELKKTGFLRRDDKEAYKTIDKRLKAYFGAKISGEEPDPDMTRALRSIVDDDYFPVIMYYYQEHMTIEAIAEAYNVEVSTITRNKKRLCLMIDNYLFG